MKILVVDDNHDDRMLLRLVVERHGHQALEAENGEQGFALAAAHRPDLIISDGLMPVLDGFYFLKKLKEDVVLKTIPFIFYSATYKADKDLALAASLGAEAYIFKPQEPDQLWRAVEEILARGGNLKTVAGGEITDLEYLRKYSTMVATKLEQKVAELEKALAGQRETERALIQAKEEWERTFEAIGDIALILAPDLRISRANRKAYEILASGEGTELVGRFCYEAFLEGQEPCPSCPVFLARGEVAGHTCEVEHQGLGKIFQVTASPVLDGEGQVVSIVHFAKDITERKNIENRLAQAQKLEAIGTLAGGIAHDFNNILTPIIGYAELVQEDLPAESGSRGHIDQVVSAGLRAKELVQQILAFSRQREFQRMPLSPQLIVKEVSKLLRATIPATIEIRENIHPECGMVLADATQLHQIVMNLATNAYFAMKERGGVLALSLRPVEIEGDDSKVNGLVLTPGTYVILEVGDSGTGMTKETMAKIFDPYFTTKGVGEGTGLGLSVVHGIVKECGGYISVYSELGKGTTFRVYLPRVVSTQAAQPRAAAAPLPLGRERVLVVDDDQAIMELNSRILADLGYRVTGLTESHEALRQFQGAPREFDLLLTDMTMPGLTGAELSLRVHALSPELPIILCSGFSELIDSDRARILGVQAFLMKPILRKELAETVRRVLDARGKREGGGE